MKTFKVIALGLAIFFGGLFMLAFLIGFVQGVWQGVNESSKPEVAKVETKAPVTTPAPAPAPKDDTKVNLKSDRYEEVLPSAKSTFMEGCVTEGSTSQCSCMYDYLDNNLTNVEFGAVISESDQGNLPDSAWEAVRACVEA